MKYKFFFVLNLSSLILLFAIIYTDFLIGQTGTAAGMNVNVLSTSSNSTTLEFILTDYETIPVDIAGNEYVQYYIPGSIFLMEKGFPQLPTHRTSIIISDDAGVKYNIIDQQFSLIETLPVAPSKGHFTRDIDPRSVPYIFDNFYDSNEWFPQSNILLDEPYVLRDLRGLTVQFNPLQYNPAEGQLKICTRLVIEVIEDVNVPAVNPLQRLSPLDRVSKEFNDIYSSLFINYGHSYYDYVPLQETGRLLIVYPTAFASNVTPFVEWKQEKGFQTLLAEYPTTTGTGNTALKTYIQNLYNTPESITFIVLVGESNQIPTINGQYEGAPSDPCYVKLAGSDAYPDAFISRISPSSATNLDYVLHKLIRYEKFPDTGPDAEWYLKGTGVASDEGSPPDWQRANLLRDMLINDMHFTHVDQIYEPTATKLQITNAINNGRSIINYIGHGSGTSWGTTGFNNSDIHNLSNGYKNAYLIDVACQNGNFTMGECFDEAWVRAGDMQNPKGAIAVYGSSTNASWVPPCDMQSHAMMLLTTRQMMSVGGLSFNGVMHAMDLWGGSSGEGLKLMEQYNIFGDCSMMITVGIQPDTTAPDPIVDLSTGDATSNSIVLIWTAPFDSTFGGVTAYDIRYSTSVIANDNDFNNAAQKIFGGQSDTAGTPKSYELTGLDFNTTYYFAAKAMDMWTNKSDMSNVVTGTTLTAPVASLSSDSMHCLVVVDTLVVDSLILSNISSQNSTLDYSIELTNNTFPENVKFRLVGRTTDTESQNNEKGSEENNYGYSFRGSGGPDLFGYEWIDSNEPNGPDYVWNDISTTGILVTNWIATGTFDPKDEGYAGPLPIGFDFKFYGNPKNQVYVSSNGLILFNTLSSNIITNAQIPNTAIPNEYIAPFWDDLDGRTQGTVHYKQEGNKFIVQFTNWQRYSATGSLTFQIVLQSNGKIYFYYNNMNATLNSATVGIENSTGTDGLQIAYNAAYVTNNLAVQISAEPEWLTIDHFGGRIYSGSSVAIIMSMETEGLELGDYSMDMEITTNDPQNLFVVVPVTMTVGIVPVELSSFSADVNDDNVLLKWSTATEVNNRGFEVERKVHSPQSAIGNWNKISFIEGKGTTTETVQYSYSDKPETPGKYTYRLKQIDFDGTISYSNAIEIEVSGPKEYALYQNYPNPFNPTTTIKFALPEKASVTLTVYNTLGEKIKDLFIGEKESGYHQISFDAANLPSGVYVYRLNAGDFLSSKKMMLVK